MKRLLIACLLFLSLPCFAQDVKFTRYDSDFSTLYDMKTLNSIESWDQPRTQYTPKNLQSEQQMRFNGRSSTGTYESYTVHFTDYDTKIQGSQMQGNDYYIYDNLGNKFKTGEHTDLNPVYDRINNNTTNIEQNKQQIDVNSQRIENNSQRIDYNAQNIDTINRRMDGYNRDITRVNNRINDLEHNMYAGLATVTALTSLHPNPRSTAPIELSVGTGIFRDQAAGAVGLFAHPNDRIMIQGGFAFGNDNNYAGYVGITIGIGKSSKK